MFYLGIDPGLSGAVAALDAAGHFVAVHDCPTVERRVGRKLRNVQDPYLCAQILRKYPGAHVTLEVVGPRPGEGALGACTLGTGFGIWLGIIGALERTTLPVAPFKWKAAYNLGSDKDQSRSEALRRFPAAAAYLSRKKDHGRAEALLIAHFGWQQRGGGQ